MHTPRRFAVIRTVLITVGTTVLACFAGAEVSLPAVFSDHAVLQRDRPLPVWGTASAGEKVTVTFGAQSRTTTADAQGSWRVTLDAVPANTTPAELVVAGNNTLTVRDLLVGEVWLCSGQSNMEKPIGGQRGQKPVFNAEEELRNGEHPQIRFLKVPKKRADAPAKDVDTAWVVCTPASLERTKFSAAGYFFGRKIHTELNVPIGLIDATWGGTRIEPWTAPEAFALLPSLSHFAVAARAPGAKPENVIPSTLFYGMIQPLAPYALRGALWYQGETNLMDVNDSTTYPDKMEALIRGWRTAWEDASMPFYYVQLAPHFYHLVRRQVIISPETMAEFWEAQEAALRVPHTGMITTTDLVDDLFDIHPRNKLDVGERLARLALAQTYGRADIEYSGPVFRSWEISEGGAELRFDHAAGLKSKDGKPLSWFTIAGSDGKFFPAKAEIVGECVIVSSMRVTAPTIVRFAWDEAANPNLVNAAGLPARPFRTDNAFNPRAAGKKSAP